MKDKSQPRRARRDRVAVLSYFALSALAASFSSPRAPYLGLGAPQGKGSQGRLAAFLATVWAQSAAGPAAPPVCASTCWPASWRPAPPAPLEPARQPAPRPARRPLGEGGDGEGTNAVVPARQAFPAQSAQSGHRSPAVRPTLLQLRHPSARDSEPPWVSRLPAERAPSPGGLRWPPTAARWRLGGGLGPTPSSPRGLPARPGPARRSPGTVPSPQVGVGRRRPPLSAALSLIPRCWPRCRPGFQTGSAGPRVLACVLPPKLTGAPCESPRLLAAPPRPHPLFPPSPPPHRRHFGTAQDLFKPWETGSGPGFALILFKNWRHRRGL